MSDLYEPVSPSRITVENFQTGGFIPGRRGRKRLAKRETIERARPNLDAPSSSSTPGAVRVPGIGRAGRPSPGTRGPVLRASSKVRAPGVGGTVALWEGYFQSAVYRDYIDDQIKQAEKATRAAARALAGSPTLRALGGRLGTAARILTRGSRVLGSVGLDVVQSAQLAFLDAQLADWAARDAAARDFGATGLSKGPSKRFAPRKPAERPPGRERGLPSPVERTEKPTTPSMALPAPSPTPTAATTSPAPVVSQEQRTSAATTPSRSASSAPTPTPTRVRLSVPSAQELLNWAIGSVPSRVRSSSRSALSLATPLQLPQRTTTSPVVLTASTPYGPRAPTDRGCKCPKPAKKKPASPRCTNPVISRRVSGDIITTRRKLTCPQSKPK